MNIELDLKEYKCISIVFNFTDRILVININPVVKKLKMNQFILLKDRF
jgi:hypothetical protein